MQSLWMLGAALSFSLMATLVKVATKHYGAAEILFYRCAFSTALVAAFALVRGNSVLTPHWREHAKRAACGTFSMGVWYYTLGVLPIATAVTLNYASPVFIGLLAAVGSLRSSGRIPNRMILAALGVGFAGVILLLKPAAASDTLAPVLLGLFAAFVAAFAFQDVKRLVSLGEPEWRLVFYFSLYSSILALIAMLVSDHHPHSAAGVALLGAIGLFGMLGQLAVSRAYGRGHILVSASLQYSSVVFAAILGIVFWHESISMQGWLGVGTVVFAGLLAMLSSARGSMAR